MLTVMKQHDLMMQKQKPLLLLSLITGTLFLLFSLFHTAILYTVSLPGHHTGHTSSSQTSQHTSATSCIQQCTVVSSESQLKNDESDESDPLKPFELLLAATSVVSGLFYLAPHTVLLVKRKLKIPIYKQVACFRI